jgi:hypothetical protein
MRTMLAIPALLFVAACAHVDYVGRSYAPTDHVDVFYTEQEVPRQYTLMGKVVATANDLVSAEKLQQKIVRKAQDNGADAVVLMGLERYKSGTSTDYHESTEDRGRRTRTHGHSSTSDQEKKEIQALFIKYRDRDGDRDRD